MIAEVARLREAIGEDTPIPTFPTESILILSVPAPEPVLNNNTLPPLISVEPVVHKVREPDPAVTLEFDGPFNAIEFPEVKIEPAYVLLLHIKVIPGFIPAHV